MAGLRGIAEVEVNLKKITAKQLRRVIIATEMTQTQIVAEAKTNHPYTDRTGDLTRSIDKGRVIETRNSISAEVVATMHYASYVEEGTSRSAPYPYLLPAIEKNKGFYRRQMAKALR